MKHDNLSDMFTVIKNSEQNGSKECVVPSSSIIKEVLKIMQKNKYIGSFEFIDDGRSGKFKVELLGRINSYLDSAIRRFVHNLSQYLSFAADSGIRREVGIIPEFEDLGCRRRGR